MHALYAIHIMSVWHHLTPPERVWIVIIWGGSERRSEGLDPNHLGLL